MDENIGEHIAIIPGYMELIGVVNFWLWNGYKECWHEVRNFSFTGEVRRM